MKRITLIATDDSGTVLGVSRLWVNPERVHSLEVFELPRNDTGMSAAEICVKPDDKEVGDSDMLAFSLLCQEITRLGREILNIIKSGSPDKVKLAEIVKERANIRVERDKIMDRITGHEHQP